MFAIEKLQEFLIGFKEEEEEDEEATVCEGCRR